MTRHLLRDDDLSPAEQAEIIQLAIELKQDRWKLKPLAGPQTVAVIFDKSSTRTRVSFAVGIADLGGSPLIISTANSQLGGKETPADTARVLERQVAAIVWRTYAQAGLEQMAAASAIGSRLLSEQKFDVFSEMVVDETAIVRLTWTGTVAVDAGPFHAGQQLTAHVAQFVTASDDRISRIETYDCYEPFGARQ